MAGKSPGDVANPVRIMIVDAEPVVREGLHRVIAGEPDLVPCGQAADCREAIELARANPPDLIIVAISLSDGSGFRLMQRIRARKAPVRFLVLSSHAEDFLAERALRAGALGFVGKHEPAHKIINAIRRVREGKLHLSDHIADRLLQGLVNGPAERSPLSSFTNRELQVFDLIRQGQSTRDIAAHLYVSCKTVETHRCRIRIKLKIPRGRKLTHVAMQWDLPSGQEWACS
jgi:DNA-binding NarL/FixJ family response regulator